jgi:hypothetical protein
MHNIYTSRVSLLKTGWNVTVPVLHRVENILVITELIIATLLKGIKGEIIQATEGFCAYLKK